MRVLVLETGCRAKRELGVGDLKKRVRLPRDFTEHHRLEWKNLGELLENPCSHEWSDRARRIACKAESLSHDHRAVDIELSDEERHVDEVVVVRRRICVDARHVHSGSYAPCGTG